MIWIAMASSAHHAPDRRFVRTQRISVEHSSQGHLFRARKYTLSRRKVAYVNCAERRLSDSAAIRVPSDPCWRVVLGALTGVAAGGGVHRGEVRIPRRSLSVPVWFGRLWS
jgi:hypothetical protein